MTATEDQYLADLNELKSGLQKDLPRVPGVIDGCCDALRWVVFWDRGWVEGKRAEAHAEFAKLQTEADRFITACEEECGMVVTVKSMREAADAYEDIDWDALLSQVDVGTMMGDRSGWVSPNQALYEAKVEPLKAKILGLESQLTKMIESMRTLDDTLQSYILGALLALAGMLLAYVGLIVALATGWTGVGAIIGLVVAIVSFLFSFVAFFTLPDVRGEVEGQRDSVSQAASVVDQSRWPAPPALPAGSW
ncbi:hypothetical protein [Tessaracoccus oleiagri]|uniref:Uncharacterized protein n=1 Tax=Tessaracoccus oleiagri TaxID=686624 RepID=A0A1G9HTC6_9ACTN|nr:hypothetical protein [Tessaracoccus oleiagri]SDL16085.1 hypothetical protein SAMN04488242_0507 [Tessaracoccus oleiagri]